MSSVWTRRGCLAITKCKEQMSRLNCTGHYWYCANNAIEEWNVKV